MDDHYSLRGSGTRSTTCTPAIGFIRKALLGPCQGRVAGRRHASNDPKRPRSVIAKCVALACWGAASVVLLSNADSQVYAGDKPATPTTAVNSAPHRVDNIPIVELEARPTRQFDGAAPEASRFVNLSPQIGALSDASDLVFHGSVTNVEYTDAVKNGRGGYPITYITFSISETLQGRYDARDIVLMFDGMGWVPPDSYVSRSDLPVLAKGDEVVIFLAAGELNGPRYVHHFFIVDGETYDTESYQLVRDDHRNIWRGPFKPKTKVLERSIGVGAFRLALVHAEPGGSVAQNRSQATARTSLPVGFAALGVEEFEAHLRGTGRSSKRTMNSASARTRPRLSVKSADKTMPLVFPLKAGLRENQK